MKLVLCMNCHDVFKLSKRFVRSCSCGTSWGEYLEDGLNSRVSDNDYTVVLGFDNNTLAQAIVAQQTYGDQKDGRGRVFDAFVIPNNTETVKRIS